MSNFNIFSIGNGTTLGFNLVTDNSAIKTDPKWKKAKLLPTHPDNLYRTYADYIANKIDAPIYYIGHGNMNAKKISNVFDGNFHLIKKHFPDSINLHFVNLSESFTPSVFPLTKEIQEKFSKSSKDDYTVDKMSKIISNFVRSYTAEVVKESPLVLNFFEKVNQLADYNNRVIIMIPDFNGVSYYGDYTPHYYKEFLDNEWVLFVNRDMKYMLDYKDDEKISDSLNLQEHEKIGEFVYHRLTNTSKLLTI